MAPKEKTELVTTKKASLLAKFGERYSMDPKVFLDTVSKTVFREAKNMEQVITLLMVADQYGLSPVTKEIYAFPDKSGGVVPVVGVDGWNRIAQQHPQFNGIEYRYAEKTVIPDGGKPCPEWVEAIVKRKDREPTIVREYLDECYRKTGPWQSHTKRMLRHKATIQGYRTAFGFHGIYDEDEAQRMYVEGAVTEQAQGATQNAARARELLQTTPPPSEPQNAPEEPSEDAAPEPEQYPYDEVTGEVIEGTLEERPDDAEEGVEEADETPRATRQQTAAINAAKRNNGWSDEAFSLLLAEYDADRPADLNREQALEVVRTLMAGPEAQEDLDV